MAGVERRRRHDPRGRRRADRRRPSRSRAPPPRASGAEGRQLLGRVERHRDRLGRRRGSRSRSIATARSPAGTTPRPARTCRSTSTPRRPSPTATSPTRTRCSCPRTSSPAAPGRPGSSSRSARSCATACRRCRAAGRSCSSARSGHSYHPDPAIREEAGTPAIVESIRAGLVFALKEAVGAEEIRRREGSFARRALASWGRNPQIRILGSPELGAARDRLARRAPPARVAARELRRRRPQRPVRDPGAQRLLLRRPLHPSHVPDRRRMVGGDARAGPAGLHGRDARVLPRQLRLLHQRGRLRLHRRGGPPARERRLEAAAAVPLRSSYGSLAARAQPVPAAAEPARPVVRRERPPGGRPQVRARERTRRASSTRRDGSSARRRSAPASTPPDPPLSPEFDRIRWFPLPGEALAELSR